MNSLPVVDAEVVFSGATLLFLLNRLFQVQVLFLLETAGVSWVSTGPLVSWFSAGPTK